MWGRLISALRTKDITSLYTACGDVRSVRLEGDNLVVSIEDEYLYNIIAGEKNIELLGEILHGIDNVAKIKIEYLKREDYVAKDIEKLKKKFGKMLNIKD